MEFPTELDHQITGYFSHIHSLKSALVDENIWMTTGNVNDVEWQIETLKKEAKTMLEQRIEILNITIDDMDRNDSKQSGDSLRNGLLSERCILEKKLASLL